MSMDDLITRAIMEDQYTDTANRVAAATHNIAAAASDAEDEVKNLNMMMLSSGFALVRLGTMMELAGAAITGTLGAAAKSGMDFNKELQYTASLAGLSTKELGRMSDRIQNMSLRLGADPKQMAAGMYTLEQTGFGGDAGIKILEAAAKSARAGRTDIETAADVITSVLHAYNMEAEDATRVSDKLFKAIYVGKFDFKDFAGHIGMATAAASVAGVKFDEVLATMATMTLRGWQTAPAAVAVSRGIEAFLKPTEEIQAIIEKAGYASGAELLRTEGLTKAIGLLAKESQGYAEVLAGLNLEKRALRMFLATTPEDAKLYMKMLKEIEGATGDLDRAFNSVMKDPMQQLEASWNATKILFIDIANVVAVPLKGIAIGIRHIVGFIHEMPTPFKWVLVGLTGIFGITLLVIGAFTRLAGSMLLLLPGLQILKELKKEMVELSLASIVAQVRVELGALTAGMMPGWLGAGIGGIKAGAGKMFAFGNLPAFGAIALGMGWEYWRQRSFREKAMQGDKKAAENYVGLGVLSSALTWGGTGAMFGSMFGPTGTMIGGALGLVGGGIHGYLSSKSELSHIADATKSTKEEVARSNAHLENVSKNTDAMKDLMRKVAFGGGTNFDNTAKDRDIVNAMLRQIALGVS